MSWTLPQQAPGRHFRLCAASDGCWRSQNCLRLLLQRPDGIVPTHASASASLNSSPPTASVIAAVQRCTQITQRSVLHRAPRRAPRLTCPTMTPAGTVAGIYLVQQEQKRKQGASAPEGIKAQAGDDIMRKRAHGTCLACAHSASATQSLKTIKLNQRLVQRLRALRPRRLGVGTKP